MSRRRHHLHRNIAPRLWECQLSIGLAWHTVSPVIKISSILPQTSWRPGLLKHCTQTCWIPKTHICNHHNVSMHFCPSVHHLGLVDVMTASKERETKHLNLIEQRSIIWCKIAFNGSYSLIHLLTNSSADSVFNDDWMKICLNFEEDDIFTEW